MALRRQTIRRWSAAAGIGLVLAALAAVLGMPGGPAARGQTQQVIFSGTIRDSIGAPPPLLNTLRLVVGPPGQSGPAPYCATGSADGQGNFQLILLPFNAACTTPGTLLSLRVNEVSAVQTVSVPSSPGIYSINFTVPVPLGGQPLPTPTPAPLLLPSQPPTTLHTTALATGCTQVIASLGAGASPAQLAGDIANPSALLAIWRFDNSTQRFAGYFADPAAPSDLTALAATDAVFVCVSSPTSITNL
jgi:hypothetical protein